MAKQQKRTCVKCGEEIPKERLEVLPDTSVCVECANMFLHKAHLRYEQAFNRDSGRDMAEALDEMEELR